MLEAYSDLLQRRRGCIWAAWCPQHPLPLGNNAEGAVLPIFCPRLAGCVLLRRAHCYLLSVFPCCEVTRLALAWFPGSDLWCWLIRIWHLSKSPCGSMCDSCPAPASSPKNPICLYGPEGSLKLVIFPFLLGKEVKLTNCNCQESYIKICMFLSTRYIIHIATKE